MCIYIYINIHIYTNVKYKKKKIFIYIYVYIYILLGSKHAMLGPPPVLGLGSLGPMWGQLAPL